MSAQRQLHTPVAHRVRALVAILLGVVLSTCQLDKLVSPGSGGQLVVAPTAIVDSAAVGSRPLRTQQIVLTSTGTGRLGWTAARVRSSSWAELGTTSGTTPDTLSVSFNPAGLFVGEYQDTVILASASGTGDTTRVPLRFDVHPCRPKNVTVGASVADSLTESDCEAPHRGGRFAKLFRLSGSAGDSLTVLLGSSAFSGYLFFDSSTVGSDPPVAEAGQCQSGAAAVCLRYVRLPRNGEFFLEVTSSGPGDGTGAFTLQPLPPRAPNAPTGLLQFATDSVTPLTTGATTGDSAFVARAQVADPDVGDSLALAVEIQPLGTAFTGTPTITGTLDSGATARVRVTGLADNTSFHWQARTVDQTGRASSWQVFGGNAEDAADLKVAIAQAPNAPTGLGQFKSDGTTAIASGGTTDEGTVVFEGTASDPDPADQVRLEVEVQPFGTAFTDIATAAGVLVTNGSVASVTVTGLVDGGQYHWQVRTVDQTSKASEWVPFAGAGQTTEDFNVVLPGADLTFETQPTGITAGSNITPAVTVQARKVSGDADTTYTGSVSVVIAPSTGSTGANLTGTTTVTAVKGLATFANLSIDLAGTGYRLLASASGLNSATSDPFDVTASNATRLALTTSPGDSAASGAPLPTQPVVQLQDASGNPVAQAGVSVIAAIASGPAGATLAGDTVVTGSAGDASFSTLAISGPLGNYTLQFQATGLTPVSSGTIALWPGSADPDQTTAAVPNGTAGSPTTILVTVRDGAGNQLTTGGAAVTVTVTGANSASPSVTDNGDGTYSTSYTPTAAGTDMVAITLNGTAISGSPYTSQVTSAGGTSLVFLDSPTSAVAGTPFSPSVRVAVEDANGNTVTSSTAAVTIAIGTNPSGGTLSGTATVNAVSGVATFSDLSIDKVGSGYTLTASGTGLTGTTSPSFDVTPGAAAKVVFTGQPSNVVAGATILPPVSVTVQDANGNTITSSTASITVGIGTNPNTGSLSGTLTVAAVNGVASFSDLSIDRAGIGYTLTAASSGLAGGISDPFDVEVGTGNQLAFTVQPPGSAVAGATLPDIEVAVQDDNGNTVTSSTASITVAIGTNPGGGTLSGTKTVQAVNGVATFTGLSIDKTGSGYTLTASGGGLLGATSGAFNITPASAAKLAFIGQPSSVVAGAAISPAVRVAVQDQFGNTVTGSSASVSVTIPAGSNPGGGALSGTTAVNASNGVATFSTLSIDKAGTGYALAASSSGLTGATSNGFNVTAAAAAQLGFVVQPTDAEAGASIAPAVQVAVQDAYGNTVTSSTATVDLTTVTNPGSGPLSGDTSVTAVNGIATFGTLAIERAGTGYTLGATSGALTGGPSNAFTIRPAAPDTLVFQVQPQGANAGVAFSPSVQVAVRDAYGNTVDTATRAITVGIGENPGGGTLSGTQKRNAVAGVASFSDLSIDMAANGYTLVATDSGSLNTESESFDITVGSGNKLAFVVEPSNAVTGAANDPAIQVQVQDAGGNLVNTATNAITLVLVDNPGGATLAGGGPVSASGGVATFSNVRLDRTGSGYTLLAFASGLDPDTSAAFNITKASTSTAISSDVPDPSITGQQVAVAYSVTVAAPGSGTPTGNVTVSDGTGATCVAAVSAGSCLLVPTTTGSKTLTATYAGDANFTGSTSPGVAHTVNTAATTTAIDSVLPVTSVTGQPVTVYYTVDVTSPGGGTPSGVVNVTDGTDSCAGSPAAGSCQLTFTSVGTKSITAAYGGDANYTGSSTSSATSHAVTQSGTITTITSDAPDPSVGGQAVTVSVAVAADAPGSGVPTGTVTVNAGTGISCDITLASGTGSCDVTFLTAGTKSITATYSGDTDYAGSTSGTVSHQVNPALTTTTVSSSANPALYGDVVTFTAAVTSIAGTPIGSVQFKADGANLGPAVALDPSGQAQLDVDTLSVGTYVISAEYSGAANYAASADTLNTDQVVNAATTTTTVASSANPSVFGAIVTFTATVDGGTEVPTGTVQFKVDGVNLEAPVALGVTGQVQINVDTLSAGTYGITAVYSGDANFGTSTGTLSPDQEVTQAATTTALTTSLSPSTYGDLVTFTAAVTSGAGTPTGTVQFKVDGANLGTPVTLDGTGQATIDVDTLSVGTYTITADYGGSTNFASSTGTLSPDQVVQQATTSTALASSVNPSAFGQNVTFTATVNGGAKVPTGTVQFKIDGGNLESPVALDGTGQAQISVDTLSIGTYGITAEYGGSTNFTASTGTLDPDQSVDQAATTTTVSSSANPSTYGQNVTFTATVDAGGAIPTGAVQFKVDGVNLETPVTLDGSGQAQISVDTLSVGTYVISAAYGGATNFGASTGTLSPDQVVDSATTTTAVSSSSNPSAFGATVTFTATVTSPGGTPTGTVQFKVDGANLETPVALDGAGQAQISVDTLSVGTYVITAEYGGATNYATSTGTLDPDQVVNVASTSTTVTSSVNPSTVGQSVTFTATVTSAGGTPTGTIRFRVDGSDLQSPPYVTLVNGVATSKATTTLTAGTHVLTATYTPGTTNFSGSVGTLTGGQVVLVPTTTTVGSSANPSTYGATVTFTATVTGTGGPPTGSVQFKVDGASLEGPQALDGAGQAQMAVDTLSPGTYVITAEYGGDATFAASTGTLSPDQTVNPVAGVLALNDGGGQSATVATAVSTPPSVLVTDSLGNPVTGTTVTFTASGDGAVVTGAAATSDGSGIAAVDSWTLGTTAGVDSDTLYAVIGIFDTLAIPAEATAGTADAGQTTANVPDGTAGSPTPITITVLDTYGNKVTGQAGLLAGSVTGANTATLAAATEQTNDTTYTTSYTPTVAGDDTVTITLNTAEITGSPYASTVSPAAAASLTLLDGDNQVGLLGKDVNIPPSIGVEDAYGNPVPDASVDLAVTAGGGTVGSATAVADTSGTAQVSSWTLGSSPGANTLRAAVPGDTITVSATGQTAQYQVGVRYFGSSLPTTTQQAAFTDAATRWQQIVFGDVPDVSMTLPADWCSTTGVPAINEVVDDLVIYAQVDSIDGAGGILGQAGPCYVRTTGGFPILGVMQFDSADLAGLEAAGQLGLVIEHEMGHVLGIGSLWNLSLSGNTIFDLLAEPCPATGTCTTDPHFVGTRGIGAFDDVGGTSYVASAKVPVENGGGVGTVNSHWRETVFSNELMTGYLDAGSNPLSVMTVASLLDMGYLVSYPDADAYTWSAAAPSGPAGTGGVFLPNDVLRLPIGLVDPNGQVTAVIPNRG